jgi:hypothetical protein
MLLRTHRVAVQAALSINVRLYLIIIKLKMAWDMGEVVNYLPNK